MSEEFIPLRARGVFNNEKNKFEDKPPTEQKLFLLQDKWLQTKDDDVWDEMVTEVFSYTRSLVLKKLTGKKFLEEEEVSDAAASATLQFMSQYLKADSKGERYEVGASFAGLLNFKVLEALYSTKDEDKHVSLEQTLFENKELKETIAAVEFDPLSLSKCEEFQYMYDEFVEEIETEVYDIRLSLLIQAYVLMMLRTSHKVSEKPSFYDMFQLTQKERAIIQVSWLEFIKRVKGLYCASIID